MSAIGRDAALAYARAGRRLFPCKPDKTPHVRWKDAATMDPDTISGWWRRWPDAMIGLPTGDGLAVIDLDVDKTTGAAQGEATAERLGLMDEIRKGLLARTPSGGLHAWFAGTIPTTAKQIGPCIDTRGDGGYVIAPGSRNERGSYEWCGPGLGVEHLPALPAAISAVLQKAQASGQRLPVASAPDSLANAAEVREILSWIDPDAGGYHAWCAALMALHDHFGGSAEGLAIADEWSQRGPKHRPGEVRTKWSSFTPGGGVGIGTLCASARQNGADLGRIASNHRGGTRMSSRTGTLRLVDSSADPIEAPEYSEEAIALRFAGRHRNDLRHVAQWGRWMRWSGKVWEADETNAVTDLIRHSCREAALACPHQRRADALASARTAAAVERLARADRRLSVTTDIWDADPWLLNTATGVVDLATGDLRAHRPEDHMTRIAPTAPDGHCPVWLTFLDDVTDGDHALQAFLQRLAGYALTGSTREHALAFLHGTGGNGKSVFIETLAGILGDYHKSAPIETFTASGPSDRHPTDLAMLRGARLVTSTETEEGKRWAESRIKSMTGGDRIVARFMRQDFFEFTPQFKLLIAGNHKPGLRSVDEAIRRRLHLVPFTVTIPPERRDRDLGQKLRKEWPGILAWAIAGCLDWQKTGLTPPPRVLSATESYLEGQDAVGAWMGECCERREDAWTERGALYASWKTWAERNGEFALNRPRFFDALEGRGLVQRRKSSGRGFEGICMPTLKAAAADWQD